MALDRSGCDAAWFSGSDRPPGSFPLDASPASFAAFLLVISCPRCVRSCDPLIYKRDYDCDRAGQVLNLISVKWEPLHCGTVASRATCNFSVAIRCGYKLVS